MNVTFFIGNEHSENTISFDLRRVLIVGYSGRNTQKIMAHIKELEEQLGVKPPKKIPTIFETSLENLTFEPTIRFIGNMTSGEAEYVIVKHHGEIYIGLGSDHTDRDLESISVLKAKQICPKPMSNVLIPYTSIKDHWDEIKLESWQSIKGKKTPYQQGTLGEILPVETIITELENRIGDIEDTIIFSGTVPLIGEFMYGEQFEATLYDANKGYKLSLHYNIDVIGEEER